jgi:hypothetical protein
MGISLFSAGSVSELITNGGMEIGDPPTGWTNQALEIWERSSNDKHTGTYSGHAVDSTPNYGSIFQAAVSSVGPTYKVSGWVRAISGTVAWWVYRTDPGYAVYAYETITPAEGWVYKENIILSSGNNIIVRVRNDSDEVAAEFYVDDVSVVGVGF